MGRYPLSGHIIYISIYTLYLYYIYILVGGFNPKHISQWEGLSHIFYGKIKFMFETTNKYVIVNLEKTTQQNHNEIRRTAPFPGFPTASLRPPSH
jgi:hypothetical protein